MRSIRRNGEAGASVTRRKAEPVAVGRVIGDMRLFRYVGFIDLGVATVVLVTLVLPAREMYASSVDTGSETDRFALAASVAFVDRLDVIPALDYANRALSACEAH